MNKGLGGGDNVILFLVLTERFRENDRATVCSGIILAFSGKINEYK